MIIDRNWNSEEPHLQPTSPVASEVEPNLPPIERGGGKSGLGLSEWTGREVLAREFPPLEFLDFVGRPCIAVGTATLISAYPKVGKTTALRASIEQWRREGRSVLFITEESDFAWHERLTTSGPEWADVAFAESMNAPPSALLARMTDGSEEVVVIDTARTAFGIRDENDNSEVQRKSAPWIAGARATGKTLVVATHDNKAGGEHGRAISGGHALFAAFDSALMVRRVSGSPNRREVEGWARLFDPPAFMYEMQLDGSLLSIGDAAAVELAEVTARAADVLTDEWQTRKSIMADLENPRPSYEQLRRALNDLVGDGIAERDPAETHQGATYKWRAAQPHLQPSLSIGGRSGSPLQGDPE